MPWPEATDYNEAIQNPAVGFADPDLRQGQPEVNAMGWPLPCSGNFAAVYKVFGPDGTAWAVKCFTRQVPGLRERYHAVSAHLLQARLPFAVDFQYLQEGIRIRGDWYAVVKMRWVEGFTLNAFLKDHADKPPVLERLAGMWLKLARELRRAGISHADLQHGNVLLVPGGKTGVLSVRLIDYDGMWVPALAQSRSGEVGHANYQHPERARKGIYDAEVDRFPHLVIYTALRALLAGGRSLWDRHDNGENLLFREADFLDPGQSALLRELAQSPDPAVRALAGHLSLAGRGPVGAVPLLADLVRGTDGGEVAPLSAEQEQELRGLLGKPKAGAAAGKPPPVPKGAEAPVTVAPVSPVPPVTVSPVKTGTRPRRARPAPAPAAGPDRRKLLLLAGGGSAAALLLVVVLILVLSGGKPAPPAPGPFVGGPPPGFVNPGQPNGQPGEGEPVEAAWRPQFPQIPEVVLFPGEERVVEVKVARRGYAGPIELRVRQSAVGAGGVPGGPGMPGGKGPGPGRFGPPGGSVPPGGPMTLQARLGDVVVPERVTIPPASDTARFRLATKDRAGAGVHEFELTASVEPAPGQPLVSVREEGAGMALPGPGAFPGAEKGVIPGGVPNHMVRRFLVTVRKAPRGTPTVLPVAANPRTGRGEMQIEVVRGPALTLDYDPRTRRLAMLSSPGGGLVPAEVPRPTRMVLVQASFPYKAQLEEFRKALRLAGEAELFDRPETAPRFLGLNVLRREIGPGGQKSPWEPLYRIDPESGRLALTPALETFFRQLSCDEDENAALAEYLVRGLACPLPRLAGSAYPPMNLVGINPRPVVRSTRAPRPGGPPAPGEPKPQPGRGKEFGPKDVNAQLRELLQLVRKLNLNDPNRKARQAELNKLLRGAKGDAQRLLRIVQEYHQKITGGMMANPRGGDLAEAGPGAEPFTAPERMHLSQFRKELQDRLEGRAFPLDPHGSVPLTGPAAMPGMPPEPAPANRPARCLLRFLDVEAAPGKTYQYSIQVCMANPNFGRRDEVRTEEDAHNRCLLSEPALTPPVSVEPDWQFYVVDQSPLETRVTGSRTVDRLRPVPPDRIAVQIHRWVPELEETGPAAARVVADWVIAERLLIRRGEVIGRGDFEVEVPVWDAAREGFVLGRLIRPPKGKGAPAVIKNAVPVDFAGPSSPVLADFWGSTAEDGYVEALALSADGRLTVRDSRADFGWDRLAGSERQAHYDRWRSRVQAARRAPPPPPWPAGSPKNPFGK